MNQVNWVEQVHRNCLHAVLTGIRAPERISRKNRGLENPVNVGRGERHSVDWPVTSTSMSSFAGIVAGFKLELHATPVVVQLT